MLRTSYVCGIAECLFKTTPHKKKGLSRPLMSLPLFFICNVDGESFSVVLRCEKLLLSCVWIEQECAHLCVPVCGGVDVLSC